MKRLFFLSMLLILAFSQVIYGQIPKTMSYQGVLKYTNDVIVEDNDYSITFKIFDVPLGGDSLWTETQLVAVSGGIMDVILGAVNPLNLPFDKQYWLGVSIETLPELSPRIQLTTTPYSFRSQVADTVLAAISVDSCLWDTNDIDVWRETGDVGIGTSSPSAKLTVHGTNTQNAINVLNSTGNSVATIWPVSSGDGALDLRDAGGSQKILLRAGAVNSYINSAGNFGIGTSTPEERLHVDGNVRLSGFKMAPGAADGHVLTSNASGVGTWQPAGSIPGIVCRNDSIYFVNASAIVFDNSDNVVFDNSKEVEFRNGWTVSYFHDIHMEGNDIDRPGTIYDVRFEILPEDDNDANLGIPSLRWSDVYAVTIHQGHTVEDIKIEGISEDGYVVVWESGELRMSYKERDRRVFGVSCFEEASSRTTPSGKSISSPAQCNPAISGVFVIRVTGEINEGDLLVTSAIRGHAMVDPDPKTGTVIAQALESYNGESGLIKAMIRKF